jgi:uncharacterized protein YbbK (DUF523 family)
MTAASGPTHLPSLRDIREWANRTPNNPLRVLVSGCVAGLQCGVDGTSYGEYGLPRLLLSLTNVHVVSFCPEDFAFGTPREVCNIHGGDGFDVLEGKATVLTESGVDWTEAMLHAAERMLHVAQAQRIDLAVLMDISAACGSQVIYDGSRRARRYQRGAGVCAALLIRKGFKVVSHRDDRTLHTIIGHLDRSHKLDPAAQDHHEREWYRTYFGV